MLYVVFQTLREGLKRRLGGAGRATAEPGVSAGE
jgi:hypothetical protein